MSPHSGGLSGGEETDNAEEAPVASSSIHPTDRTHDVEDREEDEEEDEEEVEEEEPKLKYASLTRAQGSIYRNGDAASSFLVAGDKMVRANAVSTFE